MDKLTSAVPSQGRIELAREPDFALGELRVRPSRRELTGAGAKHVLQPRVMQVLVALAQSTSEVVSKRELILRCWDGLSVSDDAIGRCIAQLRRTAASWPKPLFEIETIAGVGYRLEPAASPSGVAAEHEPLATARPDRAWRWIWVGAAGAVTLAVVAGSVWIVAVVATNVVRPTAWSITSREIVANTALDERKPDLSPDGRLIVYDASEDPEEHRLLYLKNLSGGDALRFAGSNDSVDFAPAFSPDSQQVAFVRMPWIHGIPANPPPCSIVTKPVPDGLERVVGRCQVEPYTTRLSWSKSGDALFFSDRPSSAGARRIRRLDLKTGKSVDVTHPPPGMSGDFNGTISPDGRSLAFVRRTMSDMAFPYVQNLETGKETPLSTEGAVGYIAWAPDGAGLFASVGGDIWWFPMPGRGVPQRLTTSGGHGRIATSGGLMAFEISGRSSHIVRLSGRREVAITTGERSDFSPDVSVRGELAFMSADGPVSLWVQRDGEPARVLLKLGLTFATDPRWSPNGGRIAFVGSVRGDVDLYLVDTENGGLIRLRTPGFGVGAPAWTPDGKALVYPLHEAAGWRIWRREVVGPSNPRPISGFGWRHVRIYDGQTYAVREAGPGLWRLRDGGVAVEVTPDLNGNAQDVENNAHGWALSRGRLYFVDVSRGARDARVMSRPLAGGPPETVATGLDWAGGPTQDWYGGLAVDPVSGDIIYAKSGRRDDDIGLYHLERRGR